MRIRSALRGLFATALLCLMSLSANAAGPYPTKPVRILVGFPASGISDNLARVIAKVLSQQMGQQFIIDNRPGAGTTIAADIVAKSQPDGYTLFMQDITSHAINATLYRKLPYDSVKDFTPITLVASTPLVMVVHPSLGVRNVKELVALTKTKPGQLAYGSSGIGSITHLAGELFKQRAGIDLLHVPYKGATGAVMAMLGGEVTVAFATTPTAVPLVKAGTVSALAVTTAKRATSLPEVPTMAEAGISGYEIVLYSGILAPAGLPREIVSRLRDEIFKAIQAPEVKAFYATVSADPVTSTSEEFAAHISSEIKKLGQTVQISGAHAD